MLQGKITAEGVAPAADANPSPAQDRRNSERYVTVLKVGRAMVDGHEQLCLVRNMSRDGAKLDLYHEVHENQKITIELRSDKVVTGTVRWVGDRAAGIQFDEPVDVGDMLQGRPTRSVLRKLPRAPRFPAKARVKMDHDNGPVAGDLVNISLHGLCLKTNEKLRTEDKVIARVEGLPPRNATIRWIREGMIGLHFAMPLTFSDLARWLETHQPDGV
ncbi:MAG: PilZ domain-containing protein [Sphingobium sp.]